MLDCQCVMVRVHLLSFPPNRLWNGFIIVPHQASQTEFKAIVCGDQKAEDGSVCFIKLTGCPTIFDDVCILSSLHTFTSDVINIAWIALRMR
ncbi:hypothetical protein A0H81_12136 [Grifola frondosa]|uniref:Uncharacterized protein n=1 Tax=Grifola frondosa TaxID=5627 RepID=A0A1C7LYG7_GRIFR|nr:hypothetical protein A0H81_12136 [Grifola frondosa]